ncbi:hypothetical protein SEEPB962_11137, partial [Salmonella enterica subsp. enterica serovar Paratyphi B str. ATCC 51962]
NRNRIRSLFIFLIKQLLMINDPKFSEIFPNFCIPVFLVISQSN